MIIVFACSSVGELKKNIPDVEKRLAAAKAELTEAKAAEEEATQQVIEHSAFRKRTPV